MLEFMAMFSPRLKALLSLPRASARLLAAVEDVIHDQNEAFPAPNSGVKLQIVKNEVQAVRLKLLCIRRE
tara:strand:+ start:2548 stop:2757 length:210 start_codon:yes stop_codon:yes gene_type:complete